jgi:hypothetical protein
MRKIFERERRESYAKNAKKKLIENKNEVQELKIDRLTLDFLRLSRLLRSKKSAPS